MSRTKGSKNLATVKTTYKRLLKEGLEKINSTDELSLKERIDLNEQLERIEAKLNNI